MTSSGLPLQFTELFSPIRPTTSHQSTPLHPLLQGMHSSAATPTPPTNYPFPSLNLQPLPNKRSVAATPATQFTTTQIQPTPMTTNYPSIQFNVNGVPLNNGDFSPLSASPIYHQGNGESFSQSVSPARGSSQQQQQQQQSQQQQQPPLDGSFRSITNTSIAAITAAANAAAQSKNISTLNDMLQRSREGLHKLQTELDSERARRLRADTDLADLKRELSNERLANSSQVHTLQLATDKETRLLRELSLANVKEQQLHTELTELANRNQKETEERIRLEERLQAQSEELSQLQDTLKQREDELHEVRESAHKDVAAVQQELSSTRKDLRHVQEQLKSKIATVKELEEGLKPVLEKVGAFENEKLARENIRLLEEQKTQTKMSEMRSELEAKSLALSAALSNMETTKEENARLLKMIQDNSLQLSKDWEAAQKGFEKAFESKTTELNQRIADLNQKQQALTKTVHESALSNATLNERLTSKTMEIEHLTRELAAAKQDQSEQVHHLREQYQKNVQELELSSREAIFQAQHASIEEQKRSFEFMLDQLTRDLNRVIDDGMSGKEIQTVVQPSTLTPTKKHSRTPSTFDPNSNESKLPSVVSESQQLINSNLQSFYASSLSFFQSTFLSKLATSFSALQKSAEKKEYDYQTQIALLKQDQEFVAKQTADRKASEESLSKRLEELTTSTNTEIKKYKNQLQEQEGLLNERANVIRELKRRYKSVQAQHELYKNQLNELKNEYARAKIQYTTEIELIRDTTSKELQNSLNQAEAISNKRLEAENKLRKKAEEEAEKYVRACQQSEERVFLLQQEKQTLISFFKKQREEALLTGGGGSSAHQRALSLSSAAANAATAEADAQLARMMAGSPNTASTRYNSNWQTY